jgi:alkylation response protein AidB-like acyl-CoA dehydrogenase
VTWLGPGLDEDQRRIQSTLTALTADRDGALTDDPDRVAGLRRDLAELGMWTLGTAEEHGGGGADRATTAIVLERLGRRWPALGLASAHAHAAVDALGPVGRFADLVGNVHAGKAHVAVVDAGGDHVRLSRNGAEVTGDVDRVDVAAAHAYLIVLAGDDTALLIEPAAQQRSTPVRRTGLAGAQTAAVAVHGHIAGSVHELSGINTTAVRTRLWLGAAAVAAGIAGAAFETAAAYAAGRQQFGGPLTALPTVRQSLLEQAGRTAVSLGAVLASDAGSSLQAAAVLRQASDTAVSVAAAALQTHGGYGYLAEYTIERILRDAVSLRAAVDAAGVAAREASALVGRPIR